MSAAPIIAAMTGSPSRAAFTVLLIVGLALRLISLPLPGTLDVSVWKIWSYGTTTRPVPTLYGTSRTSAERHLIRFDGREATVDYPPLTLYLLAGVGGAYQAIYPSFPNGPALTAAVKLPGVAFDAAIAALIFAVTRPRRGDIVARVATLAWWLNPAILIDGAVLGYLDAWFTAPALASLVMLSAGRIGLSGCAAGCRRRRQGPGGAALAGVVARGLAAGPAGGCRSLHSHGRRPSSPHMRCPSLLPGAARPFSSPWDR